MALHTNATKLASLFDPEVVGAMLDKKLTDEIKFAPLATIDTTLVGRPGDEITLPFYNYIGDASTVAEGADIPIAELTEGTTTAKIHKIGKGVQITDEAALSGYGDPASEAVRQILLSIANQVDNEMLTTLGTIAAPMVHAASGTAFSADDFADALELFGEDMDGEKVALIDPATYTVLRKANGWIPGTELGANAIIRGTVGEIHGMQIVVSNKMKGKKAAYIVKPGALRIFMKRDSLVETDRDIINKSTVITADKHFVTYLYDASKAIKMTHA